MGRTPFMYLTFRVVSLTCSNPVLYIMETSLQVGSQAFHSSEQEVAPREREFKREKEVLDLSLPTLVGPFRNQSCFIIQPAFLSPSVPFLPDELEGHTYPLSVHPSTRGFHFFNMHPMSNFLILLLIKTSKNTIICLKSVRYTLNAIT